MTIADHLRAVLATVNDKAHATPDVQEVIERARRALALEPKEAADWFVVDLDGEEPYGFRVPRMAGEPQVVRLRPWRPGKEVAAAHASMKPDPVEWGTAEPAPVDIVGVAAFVPVADQRAAFVAAMNDADQRGDE